MSEVDPVSQDIINILNNIGAGTFLMLLAGFAGLGYKIYKKVKTAKDAYDDIHRKKVLKDQEEKTESDTLRNVSTKLDEMENKIDQQGNDLKGYIDDKYGVLETRMNANDKIIEELKKTSMNNNTMMENISDSLNKIDTSIGVLIDSDCETISSFITSEYKTAMEEGEIDLITLQSIERMYKKYLVEAGDTTDEFIEKLMNELRSLPTRK